MADFYLDFGEGVKKHLGVSGFLLYGVPFTYDDSMFKLLMSRRIDILHFAHDLTCTV